MLYNKWRNLGSYSFLNAYWIKKRGAEESKLSTVCIPLSRSVGSPVDMAHPPYSNEDL